MSDPVTDQITSVWNGMLSQMTASGATREDLILMAFNTSRAVLDATHRALWPDGASGAELAAASRMAWYIKDIPATVEVTRPSRFQDPPPDDPAA